MQSQIQMVEAQLVTERQVKDLISENLEDRGFITSDKLDYL